MYHVYTELLRAVRKDDYKLIEYRNKAYETQLFNIKADPNELCDLSKNPDYKNILEDLKSTMKDLSEEYESSHRQCNKFWDAY